MLDCIFCKIASGQAAAFKVWEDANYLAFLDIRPSTKGMTLVIPKEHADSYLFDLPEQAQTNLILAAGKVAKKLEKALDVGRVAVVFEGMGVNHLHAKLYPLHGVGKNFKEVYVTETTFFENYPGYVSTVLGPDANMQELEQLAESIRKF